MYERDRCSPVSTLLFISNGTPVRVHVWEETIIVTDGAHTQLGVLTILFYFCPQNYFLSVFIYWNLFWGFFFTFYSVLLIFPHRVIARI